MRSAVFRTWYPQLVDKTVVLIPLLFAALPQVAKPIEPAIVPLAELRGRGFDVSWEFPRTLANGKATPGVLFEQEMLKLVREPLLPASGSQPALWLGDLVRELDAAGWSKDRCKAVWKRLDKKLDRQTGERVRQLVLAYDLYGSKWNPRSSGQKHGMHFGSSWKFGESDWAVAKGDREVEQIAQIVVADLASIKASEADYLSYWNHRKHDWKRIEVDAASAMAAQDEQGRIIATNLNIYFEFDLPWPFSTAEFELHAMNRLREDGSVALYLHGTGDDLHWFAGYDIYEPIRDRNGEWVGTLMIRQLGLDLDGVPDGRGDRHDNLRGQFGNLRRDAEQHFARRMAGKAKPEPCPYQGEVPRYEIRDGRRP